jgi:hypothetical protein
MINLKKIKLFEVARFIFKKGKFLLGNRLGQKKKKRLIPLRV